MTSGTRVCSTDFVLISRLCGSNAYDVFTAPFASVLLIAFDFLHECISFDRYYERYIRHPAKAYWKDNWKGIKVCATDMKKILKRC